MKRFQVPFAGLIISLSLNYAHAGDWPLNQYPWISYSHEINASDSKCTENIWVWENNQWILKSDVHGGERCGSQMYKTGFVISQIGLFAARGGNHQGIDIVADKGTNVRAVDWLDLRRDNMHVSAINRCSPPDGNGAGVRYSGLEGYWEDYRYSYWHLDCIPQSIYEKFFPSDPAITPADAISLSPGYIIGTVGETGNADDMLPEPTPNGPHLHFGVQEKNWWTGAWTGDKDPLLYLNDYSPPDIKFNYVVSNFGAADANIFSRQNSKIYSLSSLTPVYAKTFAKFGIETSDDVIVKKVRFDLLDSYSIRAIKEFNLNPDSRATVDNPNQFWYFPEWKGVFLRSRAVGGFQAPPDPNPETISDPWNYDINPDALMSFTVGSEPNTTSLAQGQYTLRVTAEDFKGNTRSDEIALVLDRIPPTGSISLADWDGAFVQPGYTNSEIIRVSLLNLSDAVSGVDAVRLSNDGVFDTEFFQNINGAGSVLWTLLSGDGQKTVYAQFRDKAGNISATVNAQIRLDTGVPSADVPAGGGYRPQGAGDAEVGPAAGLQFTSAAQFNFTWDPGMFSDSNGVSGYSITIKNLTNNTVHLQGAPTTPSFLATGLQQGGAYYAQVQARDPAGNLSLQIGTGRVIIDTTPPLISAVNDGDFTNQTLQLAASWEAADSESGIQEILYSIGTTPGSGDVKGFTSVGTQSNTTASMGTALAEGSYYWTIKAINQAGLATQLTGDGVVVDITPPSAPEFAEGSNPTPWQHIKEYNLSWTNPPDVSGIAGARVKFGAAAPVSNNEGIFYPTVNNTLLYQSPDIVDGANFIWLWLQDKAGNADPLTASKLTLQYDYLPPVSSGWVLDSISFSPIQVTFNSHDAGAGVESTLLWWRRDEAGNGYFGDWQLWPTAAIGNSGAFWFDPQGIDANYEFYTQSVDKLGNTEPAPVSATLAKAKTLFDHTPPMTVFIGDGDYTNKTTELSAYWDIYDPVSGVNDIQIGVGTTPGADDVKAFASVGDKNSATVAVSPSLPDGKYYLSFKARNRAWLWSAAKSGDGIIVDSLPPDPPVIEKPFDGEYVTTFMAEGVAEPFSTVLVFKGATMYGSGLAGSDGRFRVEFSGLDLGANQISIAARDLSGNISQSKNLNIIAGTNSANPRLSSLMLETSPANFNYLSESFYNNIYSVVFGQKIYALRSFYSNSVGKSELQVYDPISKSISDPVTYPFLSEGMASADGKIYVINGRSLSAIDPQTGIAGQKSPVPTERQQLAMVSYGGRIYTIGGYNGPLDYDSLEVYDPETDKWKVLAPMPTARAYFAAVSFNGRIFALGGHTQTSGYQQGISTVEEYNPKTNTWNSRPPLKSARYNHKAMVLNGMIVLYGGSTDVVEIYDPVSGNSRLDVTIPHSFTSAPAAVAGDALFSFTGDTVNEMRFKDVVPPAAPAENRIIVVNNPAGQEDTIEGLGGNIQNLIWSVNVSGLEEISASGEIQQILESNAFTAPAGVTGLAQVNTDSYWLSSVIDFQPKPLSVYNVDVVLRGLPQIWPTGGFFRLFEDGVIIQTQVVGQPTTQRTQNKDPSSTWIYNVPGTVTQVESRRDVLENSFHNIIGPQTLLQSWQADLNRNGGTLSAISASVSDDSPEVETSITGVAGAVSGILTASFPAKDSPAVEPLSRVKVYKDAFQKYLIAETAADKSGGFSKLKIGDNLLSRVFVVAVDKSGNVSQPVELTIFDAEAPVITGIEASPTAFSPNNDTFLDQVGINYRLSDAAYVSIKIIDKSLTTVRTLLSEIMSPSGTATIVWDGKKDDGVTALPSGLYSVVIEAKDAAGNSAAPVTVSVGVDLLPPWPPETLTPGDGVIITTNTPLIAGNAEPGAFVEVYDGNNLVANTIAPETGQFAVALSTSLTEGVHLLSVKAIDVTGNNSAPATLTVNVDLGSAYIGIPVNTYQLPFRGGFNAVVDATIQKAVISAYYLDTQLAIVNLQTNLVEKTLGVGAGQASIVVNQSTNKAFVSSNSKISVVDLQSNSITEIPGEFPAKFLAINPVANTLILAYFVNGYNPVTTVSEINLTTYASRTITQIAGALTGIGVDANFNLGIITGQWGAKIVNLSNGEIVNEVGLDNCSVVAVDSQSDTGILSCGSSLHVLDISATGASVRKSLPGVAGDLLTINPSSHLAALAQRGAYEVSIIDIENSDTTLRRKVTLPHRVYGLAINDANNTLVTAESMGDSLGWFSVVPFPDMTRPQVSNLTLSADYFSPMLGVVALQYQLSEPADVTADVISANPPYNKVKRIVENASQSVGLNVLHWNGKDDNFEILPEGEYSIRVSARDTAGNLSPPATKSLYVDMQPPKISAAAARPSVFNPAYNEQTRFVFGLSEAAKLTIIITDAFATDIKTLVTESAAPVGTLSFAWDGRGNNGLLVPPGTYTYRVKATDTAGNISETSGGICEVQETQYPVITDINEAPETLFPEDADAAKNKVVFSYSLHGTGASSAVFPVTINIIHPAAGIVKTLNLLQSAGANTAQWDGVSDADSAFAGQIVPDGVYKEEIILNVDGKIAVAQGVFTVVRRNGFSVYSHEPVPVVTVKFDDPQAQISVSRDPPVSTQVSMALQSQLAQGNILISPIYDIVSDRSFATPPMVRFRYDPLYDGDSLMLSKYSEVTKTWIPASVNYFADIKSQEIVFTLDPKIFMGSLFALFKIHDIAPPEITIAQAIPSVFSPDGDGIDDKTTISYVLSDNIERAVTINIAISDAEENTVRELARSASRPLGENKESWDGRDNDGSLLGNGTYTFLLGAADSSGNISALTKVVILLNGDNVPPVTTAVFLGGEGQNGWYVSPVSVAFTSTDAIAGVQGTYYSVDGSSFTLYSSPFSLAVEGSRVLSYYSIDVSGNKEAGKTFGAKIDLSSPTILSSVSPASNGNGWSNAPVSILFTCTDTISGIAYCSSSSTVLREGAGQSVPGFCFDNAGLSSTTVLTINIDTTAPSLQYTQTPLANEYGWNSGSVTLKYTCADNLSGIRSCPADMLFSGEGVNLSTSAKVFDYADNSRTVFVAGINIDKTLPVSSAALAGTYKNGWYSSAVSFTITSTDSISGIKDALYSLNGAAFAPYQQPIIISMDGSYTGRYYSKDKAGNVETEKSILFSVDKTAPQVGYTLNPPPNSNGWNNTSVEAVFNAADALSGTDICISSRTSVEGSGKTLSGWCRDIAGNIGYSTAVVKIDMSSPVVSALANPAANSFNWNNTPVTVTFTGTDAISDIFTCSADKTVSSEGAEQITTGSCADKAGNSRTAFRAVSIDMTKPVTTAELSGNHIGSWYNSAASITLGSIDSLSGINQINYRLERSGVLVSSGVYVAPVPVSADGLYRVYYYGADKAGNIEIEKSTDFKIDRTLPQVSYTLIPAANSSAWNNTAVQVVFNGTDTLSGVVECSSHAVSAAGHAQAVAGWCRDAAANIGYATATVNVDLTAPVVLATQTPVKNSYGWNNTSVTSTFAGSDALSGIAYCTPAATISNEGSSQTVTGYCRDYAGLSSTATLTLSIDKIAPLISAVRAPLANLYGWASQDVSVNYTCSDNLSGVRTCPPAMLFSAEGLNVSTSGTVYDYSGNTNQITVNGISIDKTKPVTSSGLSGTLVNGWYNTAVSITLVSSDALSGINQTNYRLERGGVLVSSGIYAAPVTASMDGLYVVYYYGTDNAGNAEVEKSTVFKIDRTMPQVSYTLIPAANGSSWNKTAVQVVFSGMDTLSGVVECSSSTVTVEGQAQAVAGWCRDTSGNIAYSTATVNVDLTIPVVSVAQAPAKNAYGWNNASVEATFAGTDALSGISYCEPAKIISNEGSSQTVSGYCRDYAGLSSTATLTLSIDKTAPLISAVRTPLASVYGWANQDVSVNYTCSDNLSGVRICPATMLFSFEALNVSTSAMVYDYAGSTNQVTISGISIDKTKPVTTAGLSGVIAGGWYNTAVSITLGSTDSLSGVERTNYRLERSGVMVSSGVYIAPVSASADGQYTMYYYSTDKAGNIEIEKSTFFKIDRTLPQISYTLIPAANGSAWNNTAVQVVFNGTDTLSGVVECSSRTISTEGQAQAVAGWCRDTAGNIGYSTAIVNIDLTRPVSIAAQNPAANVKGWNNSNIGVTFIGSDMLSGLSYCSPEKVISAEGAAQVISGYCMDYSGNTSTAALVLNIDKTAPHIIISSPAGGDYFVATKNKIVASYAVTDNLDPAPNAAAMLRQVEDRGSPRGARPAAIVVVNGQQIEPLDIDDGIWRLTANATDFADNISSAAGGLFEVIHDVLPPRTALAAGAGSYQGLSQALYVTGKTTFTLTSIDDLVAVADGTGLGVKKQGIGVSAEGRGLLRELVFENTNPVQGTAFTSAFKLDQEIDGAYSLAFNSEDVLANVEKVKISTFIVDNTAPQTTFNRVSGPAYLTYVSTWTLFELAPADPGFFASGVKETPYSINLGAVATSPLKFTLPGVDGSYLVKYRSKDNLDNLEVERSSQVFVDAAPPFTALNIIGGKQYPGAESGSFYASQDSKFGFTAADPVVGGGASGVKTIDSADNGGLYVAYSQPISLAEGKHAITYRAADRVENTEVIRSTQIHIDDTPPVTSFNISEPLYIKDGVRYITPVSALTFTAVDPLMKEVSAGLERIETAVDSGQWTKYTQALKFMEGRHTIKYRAIDNVGNVETERIIEVQSDNTAPVSKWSATSGDQIERGNKFYLNALGRVAFESADPVINEVSSGLEGRYYGIDAVPADKYSYPIGLAEGVRTIKFNAKDNVGNTEVVKSTVIYVDGTKPVSELSVSGDQYKSGRQYISRRTDIVIAAADPVVNDVSVGVKETKYAVDSGSYNDYSLFKLSEEGRRLVSFYSADLVNNMEVVKTAELWVDGTAPLSVLDVLGGKQSPGAEPGSFYASLATKFAFIAADPVIGDGAAGVKTIEYADGSGAPVAYAQPISLGEGKHSIAYRATDQVENTEVFRSTQIYIDNTAPVTSFNIAGPLYIKDGIRHITPESELIFASADPLVSEVSAGVERIETAVDGGQWLKYTQSLKFAEGRHTIKYRAIDNVGNLEAERVLELRSDSTPPVTAHHISDPYYVSGAGVNFITPETLLTFSANDPATSDVASGLERIETAVDGSAYALYTSALKFPEGRHTIKYRAWDNVGNLEAAQTLEVQSDATAPESRWLAASGPWIEKDNKFYLNAVGGIALESADPVRNNVASGLEYIYYGIDGAPSVKYMAAFELPEGVRTVNYSAKDNLGNTELVKSTVVYVDGTKPATALSLSGDQYNGDKQYVSRRTDIRITAADPAVNNVAAGVKETKYSVDGGAFANYSLFKLNAEGKRLVSYYSTDFVSNIETVKTAALWVDSTPPATELSIAGARYSAPGDEKIYIARDSGIVLTAADPLAADTASGVMLTKYRIDGGNWQVYLGSFTIPDEGLHTLEYYALDRVQNAEAQKSAMIAVDNTPPVTGISLGEPKTEIFGLPVLMQNTPITLTAADPVTSGVSAGLNSIFYEIENVTTGARAAVKAYTSPFTIPEQGTFIIRYWSRDNTGNLEAAKEKTAAVSTWRADGLIAASGLDMSGTADIAGTVKSNAVVSLGGNARILGDVTASTITLAGNAVITGLKVSGAVPVDPAPIYLASIIQSAAAVNNNALVAAYLVDGKLALGAHTGITLSTGTYYFKGMELSGGSSITIAGKVDILVEGSITINGGSSLNASGTASMLSIVVSTASELKFNGGAYVAACLYAPYSDMKLNGNAQLGGHYFVKTAAVSGTGNLLQAGEALPVPAPPSGGGGKPKAATMSIGSTGVLVGPDPAFRLGEVYVFPNPAKGNEAPVFHIETGIADSVKITIYTVSGRAAHEHTLTGLPVELDDGNGLSYAYEYTWSGHIPSGVYLYYLEARKAGQTFKKTGKFSVIR